MKSHLPLVILSIFLQIALADNHTNSTDGLSGGAVAGIIIGVIAGIGLLGAGAWFLFFKEGAMYASVIGRGAPTGSAISSSASSLGGNHLPMMAMRVNGDDEL